MPSALFPSHSDPQVAQVILSGIATSIMTVVSIVFAILLMTLTLASMQFSPRIIVSFAKDRVTQWTLGVFLGTFCYCMGALPTARSLPHPFAPVLTVFGAMLLALAFGVLQIVDIALKAIAPAVNDPTTAVSCVDQLSRIGAARFGPLRSAWYPWIACLISGQVIISNSTTGFLTAWADRTAAVNASKSASIFIVIDDINGIRWVTNKRPRKPSEWEVGDSLEVTPLRSAGGRVLNHDVTGSYFFKFGGWRMVEVPPKVVEVCPTIRASGTLVGRHQRVFKAEAEMRSEANNRRLSAHPSARSNWTTRWHRSRFESECTFGLC